MEEKQTLLFEIILSIPNVKENAAVALSAVNELRAKKRELEAELKANPGNAEFAKSLVTVNAALKTAQGQLTGYEKTLSDYEKATQAAEGSMVQMGAQISALTAKYVALDESTRDSKFGVALKTNIKNLSDEYKELYSEIGKDQLNVGNYAETLLGATKATQGLAGWVDTLKGNLSTAKQGLEAAKLGLTGLKGAIAATGIGLLLLALNELYSYLTRTKEGMDFVAKATRTVGSVVSYVADAVAGVGKVVFEAFKHPGEALASLGELIKTNLTNRVTAFKVILDGITNIDLSKLRDGLIQLFTGVADAGAKVNAAAAGMQAAIDADEALYQANKKLEESERALNVERAKATASINEQKFIADDQTKSIDERIAAAKKAFEIENAITQKQIALQKQRIELTERQGEADAANGVDDDKLAQEQETLANLTAQSLADQRKVNATIFALEKEKQQAILQVQIETDQKALLKARIAGEETYKLERSLLDKQYELAKVGIIEGSEQEKALTLKYRQDLIALNLKTGQEFSEKQLALEKASITARLTEVKKGGEEEYELRKKLLENENNLAILGLANEQKTTEERNEKIKAAEAKLTDELKALRLEREHQLVQDAQASTAAALARTRTGTKAELDQRRNMIRQAYAQELIDAEENADKQRDINDRMNRDINDATKDFTRQRVGYILDDLGMLTDGMERVVQAQIQRENNLLDSQKNAALKSAGLSAEARTKIEEKFAARKEELDKKAAERQRKLATAQNLIATARGVTEALLLPPPFDIIKAALVVATGAAQQVVISSQQFAHGGEIDGPSHAQGGVKYRMGRRIVELEGGEGVINKRSMAMPGIRQQASELNQIGGGVAFPGTMRINTVFNPPQYNPLRMNYGGTVLSGASGGASIDYNQMRRVFTDAMRAQPNPIVQVSTLRNGIDRQVRVERRADIGG